jgi:hypothetical protein
MTENAEEPFEMIQDKKTRKTIIKAKPTLTTSIDKNKISRSEHYSDIITLHQDMNTLSGEKKWLYTIVISVITLLIFSTFTVNIIDKFLFKRKIDLFGSESKTNEIILNIVQFILLFGIIRMLFNYL